MMCVLKRNISPSRIPQCLDTVPDVFNDDLTDVSVIIWPLSVFRFDATGSRWWMKVCPFVMCIWVPIPSTFPRIVFVRLLIMNIEILVSVPADLKTRRHLSWIVVVGKINVEIEVVFSNNLRRLDHSTSRKPRPHLFQHRSIYRCRSCAVVYRSHRQLWDGAVELADFLRARSWRRRSSITVAQSLRST